MEGEKVEMSDVHNMLHFAKVINLMDDTTSNKLDRVSNKIKDGKIKLTAKTT